MESDEMMKLLKHSPEQLFAMLEQNNVDFSEIAKEMDIVRKMVIDRYQLNSELINATEFVFWISYFAERELRDTIFKIETQLHGKLSPLVEDMIDKIYFTEKISLVEDHYANGGSKDYISMFRKVNTLRNHVAHGRIESLKYKGYSLSDVRGQIRLIVDFMNAALKKDSA